MSAALRISEAPRGLKPAAPEEHSVCGAREQDEAGGVSDLGADWNLMFCKCLWFRSFDESIGTLKVYKGRPSIQW